MREANWKNSDKYFHARGNYDAAQRGPGGAWAAEVIRQCIKEEIYSIAAMEGDSRPMGAEEKPSRRAADQAANNWGRSGGDPNVYRPEGLPSQY
ncbi:serum amyloid A-2 protein-like [Macrobrachium nipponense]|uniref:serum amyloid A-2 protein-like n=1 Tax=Macrobrachium nipponense TaxID=159736 RepID=UPI0030C7EA25